MCETCVSTVRREMNRRLPISGLAEAGVRVVILTIFESDDCIFEALRAGASGFLLKSGPPGDLVAAVRAVAEGNGLLAPSVTRRVIAELAARPSATARHQALGSLTKRETEVLRLLAAGKTNAELAADLYVEEGTIKTHVSNLLAKLRLRDRVQAVVFAFESGLVQPGSR